MIASAGARESMQVSSTANWHHRGAGTLLREVVVVFARPELKRCCLFHQREIVRRQLVTLCLVLLSYGRVAEVPAPTSAALSRPLKC
jgi:hypothetical protein